MRRFLFDPFQRLDPVVRDHGSVIGGLEAILQHRDNIGLVVDDEDLRLYLIPLFVGG